MNKELLMKSLHICLNLTIIVLDSKFKIIREYRSNRTSNFFYNYQLLIRQLRKDKYFFHIISGQFNELFLYYNYRDKHFLFGPFKCNIIDKTFFEQKMIEQQVKITYKKILQEHLEELTLYSLSDVRDILILIHYIFTGKIEDLLSESVHNYVENFEKELIDYHRNIELTTPFSSEIYHFIYENKILECVQNGNKDELKKLIFELSNGVIPSTSGDILRSEKNYSIIIFEKLSELSISLGTDLVRSYQSRDLFIKKNELSVTVNEVLQVRDSAIVFYTNEIQNIKCQKLSPLMSSILQFINLNLHEKINIKEIIDHFNISGTKLRIIFKQEMNTTIRDYIMQRKLSESKIMLKSKHSISEIALNLGFSDSSHFSKVFKKYTGTTPKKYQQSLAAVHSEKLIK